MFSIEQVRQMLYKYSDIWAPELLKVKLKFPNCDLDFKMHVRLASPDMPESEWEDLRELVKRLENN